MGRRGEIAVAHLVSTVSCSIFSVPVLESPATAFSEGLFLLKTEVVEELAYQEKDYY
jgi:hypothetical protein